MNNFLHWDANLVGQFLVQFLGYGFIELSLEVPRRDPDGIDHLHQHKHAAGLILAFARTITTVGLISSLRAFLALHKSEDVKNIFNYPLS